jgi:hypothetical protein
MHSFKVGQIKREQFWFDPEDLRDQAAPNEGQSWKIKAAAIVITKVGNPGRLPKISRRPTR